MVKISASLLAADMTDNVKLVNELEETCIDLIHIDVMDGHYVSNFAFGTQIIYALSKLTNIPIEAHLAIENADKFIDLFAECGSKRITVHPECCNNEVEDTLKKIKKLGLSPALALSPEVPIKNVRDFFTLIDVLSIMTVNPGFGEQSLIMETVFKIKEAHEIIKSSNFNVEIAVDGGINKTTAPTVVKNGANILTIGSALFQGPSIKECLNSINESIN